MPFGAVEAKMGPNDCGGAKHHRTVAKSGLNLHSSDPARV